MSRFSRSRPSLRIASSALLGFIVSLAFAACGSRTSLPGLGEERDEIDAGIQTAVDAGSIATADAAMADATRPDAARKRCPTPLSEWVETDVLLGGDFERVVAAAASDRSEIWLAAGGRASVRGATRLVRVELRAGSPRIAEDIALAATEGWEPLALAVVGPRVAIAARASSGESELAIFSRDGTLVARTSIAALEIEIRYRLEADLAWSGDDLVVAARRFGTPDHFVVERRDASLALKWSAPLTSVDFRLRPDGSLLRTSAGLYDVTSSGLRADPSHVTALSPIGAASAAWTGIDATGFVLARDGARDVRGGWPGGSFATNGFIPVYESAAGIFITGNVDLGPSIGWFGANDLTWIAVPHLGGGVVPYADANDVGLFFVGIEIPRSEQPLRYWGCSR